MHATHLRHTSVARLLVGCTAVATLLVLTALPAGAHIEPDPTSVPEGATTTISFNVEHGCSESPTTKLEMQIPAGVANPQGAGGAPGWTASLAGSVLTWTGPAQPPHTPMTITLHATMPTTPGLVHFPIVQTCEQGSVSWIEIQQPGQPEPENPAPTVDVLAPGQAAPPTTADADADASSAAAPGGTGAQPPKAATPKAAHPKTSHSNTGLVVALVTIGVGAAVAIGIAMLAARRRTR